MSDVQSYRVIRERLRNPPNAVRDDGIDLKRKTIPIVSLDKVEAVPIQPKSPPMTELAMIERSINALAAKLDFVRDKYHFVAQSQTVSVINVQRVVAKKYGITRLDLISDRRQHSILRPRQIAIYVSKKLTGYSLPKIGMLFGGRDHTTVLHTVRRIDAERLLDGQLNADIEELMAAFKPA